MTFPRLITRSSTHLRDGEIEAIEEKRKKKKLIETVTQFQGIATWRKTAMSPGAGEARENSLIMKRLPRISRSRLISAPLTRNLMKCI